SVVLEVTFAICGALRQSLYSSPARRSSDLVQVRLICEGETAVAVNPDGTVGAVVSLGAAPACVVALTAADLAGLLPAWSKALAAEAEVGAGERQVWGRGGAGGGAVEWRAVGGGC